jgi:hypothetical protein
MYTHARIKPNAVKKQGPTKKAQKGRTSVDGLLLRLHSNLALPRDLRSERDGLMYDDALSLTNDATGHAPLGSFLRAPQTSRKREFHRVRLADRPCEPLRTAPARDSADVHFWLAELRVRSREEYVGHQGELAASAELQGRKMGQIDNVYMSAWTGLKDDERGAVVYLPRSR